MEFYFEIDRPIYIQLVEKLKSYIILGELKPGTRIPSVREFSIKAKVNPNTMQKALAELEDEGLIYTERTNGKFVTNDQKLILKYKNEYANKLSKNYLSNMQNLGFDENDTINYLKGVKKWIY